MSTDNIKKFPFEKLDELFFTTKPMIAKWLSWPIVRSYLWLKIFYWGIPTEKSFSRIKKYAYEIPEAFFHNLKIHVLGWWKPKIAVLNFPRDVVYDHQLIRNFQFDDFLTTPFKGLTVMEIRCPWSLKSRLNNDYLYALPRVFFSHLLGKCFSRGSYFKKSAAELASVIQKETSLLNEKELIIFFSQHLANFYFNQLFFKLFLRWHRVKVLIVMDACSLTAEIAAAKELYLPVIEMQHGIFGPETTGYQWPSYYHSLRQKMPIPDYFLTYGAFWKKLLVSTQFWDEHRVRLVGMPTIERYQKMPRKIDFFSPFRILFASQKIARDKALSFWRDFLMAATSLNILFTISIKIHPGEMEEQNFYQPLILEFPEKVFLLDPNTMIYDAILNHHLTASFISTTLIESVALGTPAVSICSDAAKGGFAEVSAILDIQSVMPHVENSTDFINLLQEKIIEQKSYERWCEQTLNYGKAIFQPKFIENMNQMVSDVL